MNPNRAALLHPLLINSDQKTVFHWRLNSSKSTNLLPRKLNHHPSTLIKSFNPVVPLLGQVFGLVVDRVHALSCMVLDGITDFIGNTQFGHLGFYGMSQVMWGLGGLEAKERKVPFDRFTDRGSGNGLEHGTFGGLADKGAVASKGQKLFKTFDRLR